MAYRSNRRRTTGRYKKRPMRKSRGARRTRKYTGKRTTGAFKKKAQGSWPTQPEAMKQLAVYKNPYSAATQLPKIPDGSRNFSLGASFRAQNTVNSASCFVVLVPGVHTMGYAIPGGDNYPEITAGQALAFVRPQPAAPAPGAVAGEMMLGLSEMEAWRLVSAGMKIRTINNDQQNDGHYQAIRLRHCHNSATLVDNGGHFPVMHNQVPAVSTWPNDPSYSSGRIKDLVSKDFMLAPENPEHPFIDWAEPVTLEGRGYETLYDVSFDIIVVKLVGITATNLLIDMYANYEASFRSNTQLNYYQTQTLQVKPAVLSATQNMIKLKRRKAAT